MCCASGNLSWTDLDAKARQLHVFSFPLYLFLEYLCLGIIGVARVLRLYEWSKPFEELRRQRLDALFQSLLALFFKSLEFLPLFWGQPIAFLAVLFGSL